MFFEIGTSDRQTRCWVVEAPSALNIYAEGIIVPRFNKQYFYKYDASF